MRCHCHCHFLLLFCHFAQPPLVFALGGHLPLGLVSLVSLVLPLATVKRWGPRRIQQDLALPWQLSGHHPGPLRKALQHLGLQPEKSDKCNQMQPVQPVLISVVTVAVHHLDTALTGQTFKARSTFSAVISRPDCLNAVPTTSAGGCPAEGPAALVAARHHQ